MAGFGQKLVEGACGGANPAMTAAAQLMQRDGSHRVSTV